MNKECSRCHKNLVIVFNYTHASKLHGIEKINLCLGCTSAMLQKLIIAHENEYTFMDLMDQYKHE